MLPMTHTGDWKSSGWIKVERAKEHIRNLESEIESFLQRSPYAAIGNEDPDTGDWVVRAQIREHPPLRWGAITGDAIHNLRASLDILWRHIFLPSVDATENRKIQFPIFDSAEEYQAHYSRPVKSSRKPAMDILKALKPYKGGNDLLWLLHKLDIIDKHRSLIPAYSTVGTTIIDLSAGKGPDFPPMRIGINWADPACPVEDGTELWRVPAAAKSQVDMNPQFPFTIAFGEAEIVKGKPIIATVNQLASEVDGIAEAFTRAGLLR